jgi:hypothetical protein
LAPDVEKRETTVSYGMSFRWKVDEKSGSMMPLNVTSDFKSDLIGAGFVWM